MAIPVGSKAPDFTLKSKSPVDVEVKLGNNLGKKNTVLLFFPLAFTGVCTAEMCSLTAGLDAYAGLGAEVIAVSVDSPFAQAAWAKQEKIGITLASDLNKTVTRPTTWCSRCSPAWATPRRARRSSLIRTAWCNTASRRRRRKTCRTSKPSRRCWRS